MDSQTLSDLIPLAQCAKAYMYVDLASLTLMIFDYCLTINREIELVWKARFGYGKALYLISRYLAFFDVPLAIVYDQTPNISTKRCQRVYSAVSWSFLAGIGVAQLILVLRTYALSANNKKLLWALLSLFAGIYVPATVILTIYLRHQQFAPQPVSTITGCFSEAPDPILFIDFVLFVCFETIIIALTLYHGFKRYRHSSSPLIITLYRDGILFYIYLFILSVGNTVSLPISPPSCANVLVVLQRVIHSILSVRIVLHVREADRSRMFGTSGIPTLTVPAFRAPSQVEGTEETVECEDTVDST